MDKLYKTANLEIYRSKINEIVSVIDTLEKELEKTRIVVDKLDELERNLEKYSYPKDKVNENQLQFEFVETKNDPISKAMDAGILSKKGNWYYIGDKKFLGKEKTLEYLEKIEEK